MNDLDYERWRGSVTERLLVLKEGQDELSKHIDRWGERIEKALRDHIDDDQNVETGINTRLSALEAKQSHLIGQLIVFGALSSAVLAAAATAVVKYVTP